MCGYCAVTVRLCGSFDGDIVRIYVSIVLCVRVSSFACECLFLLHVFIPVFIIVVVRHFFKKVVASEFLNFADLKIELCDLSL